jgi:hypothetical protein
MNLANKTSGFASGCCQNCAPGSFLKVAGSTCWFPESSMWKQPILDQAAMVSNLESIPTFTERSAELRHVDEQHLESFFDAKNDPSFVNRRWVLKCEELWVDRGFSTFCDFHRKCNGNRNWFPMTFVESGTIFSDCLSVHICEMRSFVLESAKSSTLWMCTSGLKMTACHSLHEYT